MSNDVLIRVQGVSKKFARTLKRSMMYGVTDIARDLLGLQNGSDALRPAEFWAVDDVSFEVRRGEVLGIIGPNGSGKSTMLKMLNGIYMPDRGQIEIGGRVGALIEVGAGFHPMLTGRENIYINGAILGMSKREVDQRWDEIIEFSGLESEFIDTPVKFYSSGMYVRLGFSVAAHCTPDILLVDEVLAVGDMNFQQKCLRHMRDLVSQGRTVVFVSHSMAAVSALCNQIVLLDHGLVQAKGLKDKVIGEYADFMNKRALEMVGTYLNSPTRRGTGEVRFTDIKVLDEDGSITSSFPMGSTIRVRANYLVSGYIDRCQFYASIRSASHGIPLTSVTGQGDDMVQLVPGKGVVEFEFGPLSFRPGVYTLYVAAFDARRVSFDVWENPVGGFRIISENIPERPGFTPGIDAGLISVPYSIRHLIVPTDDREEP